MALFSGLARDTTGDLLIRVRVASVAMLLLGTLFGGMLVYFWSSIAGPGPLNQRLIYGGIAGAPVLLAFIVYVYLTLGVIPALRERFASLKRSADTADPF